MLQDKYDTNLVCSVLFCSYKYDTNLVFFMFCSDYWFDHVARQIRHKPSCLCSVLI